MCLIHTRAILSECAYRAEPADDWLGEVGQNNEECAYKEKRVEILVLLEENGCQQDAIDGFEVDSEVGFECREVAEQLHVQRKGVDGAYGG